MNFNEKKEACVMFFNELACLLKESYEVVESCNKDFSRYLVPYGTSSEVTYYGKPAKSFRISDHWNWFANLNKCNKPKYIQCLSVDAPWVKKRFAPGKASKPVMAIQVSLFDKDGKYHVVYGEKYNKKTRTWEWIDNSPATVLAELGY